MAQTIVPGDGGVWVLMEESAPTCAIDLGVEDVETAQASDGIGKGALALFLTALGAAALHLSG